MAPETPTVDWRVLLQAEVDSNPRGMKGAAELLGRSRTYVSRALGGKAALGEVSEKFIKRVYDTLYIVRECPATKQRTPRTECDRIGNGCAPVHNPLLMQIWRECQSCPFKPTKEAICPQQ